MQNLQQQYSCKVITGSFDDLQHIVYTQIKIIILTQQYPRTVITGSFEDLQHNLQYAQIKIIILTHICCKIEQISNNNMKSIKQASTAH